MEFHPIKHFLTISRHRHKVMFHCFKCGIFFRGLLHDLSKFSPSEFISGCKYFEGNRSPNEKERELFGYSKAWMHHKGRNLHHFEYWTDLDPTTKRYEPVPMPKKFLTEMFCDRVAASKIYKGKDYTDAYPLEYFLKGNARQRMHPKTADELEFLLSMLKDKGEDETFKFIKHNLKSNKDFC